eukprot:TRINITY_DN27465_c0_g1_i6.p1 TRINITY_DN27465_c0_g1~~TRINITY_DN27465_c0_g1_i6.p1  ORF type:complete len:148 (+),score=19.61 TRINITY_DN27465_c0_g1_i6:51-446(+)
MKRLLLCVVVVALLTAQSYADTSYASSSSHATYAGGAASAHTHDYTYTQGDSAQAYADGYAGVWAPGCVVIADSDTYAIILANCGVLIADAFAAAFAGGTAPFSVVATWAVENGFTCQAISDAQAYAHAFC